MHLFFEKKLLIETRENLIFVVVVVFGLFIFNIVPIYNWRGLGKKEKRSSIDHFLMYLIFWILIHIVCLNETKKKRHISIIFFEKNKVSFVNIGCGMFKQLYWIRISKRISVCVCVYGDLILLNLIFDTKKKTNIQKLMWIINGVGTPKKKTRRFQFYRIE